MTSAGASEVAYYFIVKDTDLKKAIHAVHGEFFQKGSRLNIQHYDLGVITDHIKIEIPCLENLC